MTKILKIFISIFAGLIALCIAVIIFIELKGSALLKQNFQQQITNECPTCVFSTETLTLSFFSTQQIYLENVKFETRKPLGTNTTLEVEKINAHFQLMPLLHHQIIFDFIEIEKPTLVVIDDDSRSIPDKSDVENSWLVEIKKTKVQNARFKYVRETHGTHANLKIHKINAEFGDIDSTLNLESVLMAHLTGQIERSGEIDLNVKIKSFLKPLQVDVDFKAKDQNLEDLTPFFKENAGVILKGILHSGHGTASLRHDSLTAAVLTEYQNLDVTLVKTYESSDVSIFFTNLAARTVMSKQNKDKPSEDKISEVTIAAIPKESVVGFFLRGFKEAAIKVTRK